MQDSVKALISNRRSPRIAVMIRAVQLASIATLSLTRLASRALVEWLHFNSPRSDAAGNILASMLERMGPTFIKFGQVLSSRQDLISNRIAGPLTRLRDQVDPLPATQIATIIEESFGAPLGQIFTHFESNPVATGSIAQVHIATLKQGQTVAVKVQRPSLKILMAQDFAILDHIGLLLEHVPGFRRVPFRGIFRELEIAVTAQLDFEREANNNRRFYQNLKKQPRVHIPRLVPELCNSAVITMEYMRELIPVEVLQLPGETRRVAAKAGLKALYQMIFVDGLVHADLHAGNIFFQPNGEIVILDFGLVAHSDDKTREQFRKFFVAMATNRGALCAKIIEQTAESFAPGFDSVSYTEAMSAMVDRFAGRRVQDFGVARFAVELFALQRRFGIRGSTAFTMTITSLLLFEGVLKTLDPEMDFQREAVIFLLTVPTKTLEHPNHFPLSLKHNSNREGVHLQ